MDPTWLASLFGPGALNTSQLTGGTLPPTFEDRYNNQLPFATPTTGFQVPPMPVPSAAPAAPSGAPVENPPAMPPAIGPAPSQMAGLVNQAGADPNRILATLRGIQAPAAPVPQHITTPHPPATHAINPGNLAQLFASLGISPSQLPQLSGKRL